MSILIFEVTGDMALWRNVYEPMGNYSCLGPAPSNLAGLCGAALGFASPRSHAAELNAEDTKKISNFEKKGLPWPLSPELLAWEETNDVQTACRWIGKIPIRAPWNVNGNKTINDSNENLRIQQQVIFNPAYEVALRLKHDTEVQRLAAALKRPAFPLALGASFCRAIVRNIRISETLPENSGWAHRSQVPLGEAVPLSRHVVNPEDCFERIESDGYWLYPTPEFQGIAQDSPFVSSWIRK